MAAVRPLRPLWRRRCSIDWGRWHFAPTTARSSGRHYTGTVKAYGLTQESTTPYTPEQNVLVERFFRSLKEECIWQHRFESLGQARVVIDRWIRYYNEERPPHSLGYVAPRAHLALTG
ncbi:integrase core domain-containing protein [Halomonas sp. YLB-10]|uniref:integrase core domain-containing protein n=1 Tax=Halomonas sp. YLB-10 TaxID=2483111 RepID=UPI00390892CC